MDNPIFPWIFAVVASVTAIIFLWDTVLPLAKSQLKPGDMNTAKFFLFLLSLTFLVVAVYYGGDIIQSVFISDSPI
jgi:hypothetical protein